jgi:endonuclease/exonuclease/phosphatase family metal-dependent hydrolase
MPSAGVAAARAGGPQITVMSRNLYLGTNLSDLVGVSSSVELGRVLDEDWATVLANDFPTRARALADEIAHAQPDVVGLQEVTLWRDQTPSDLRSHPGPNATHVALDLLAGLSSALAARGTPYTAVATSTNADLEGARNGAGAPVDLRITDRDVILVRADRVDRVRNPANGHYAAERLLPSWPGPIRNTRGWASIDYRTDSGTVVRIVSTHLEVSGPRAGRIQERQAGELLAIIRASPHPVIALGDFNAGPDGATRTYEHLTAVLDDAWARARPGVPGPTCCQAERLDRAVAQANLRLDLVLVPEDWPVSRVARTGAQPFRVGPPPLWASDHVGVTAQIHIRR